MKKKILFIVIYCVTITLQSQTIYPKREHRSAWIATVYNIDYPSNSGLTTATQKNEFIAYLNKFKQAGINVVYVQVRPSCDAFYTNPNEPWSEWLSGTQGTGPSPAYDPLAFYIAEAHKRGMELHAWINPYRSVTNIISSNITSSHVSVQQPSWNVLYNNGRMLNPGLQAVRNYVSKIIMYMVRKYDIDGIHFDDYFYPYPASGQTFNDAAAFSADPRGFTNIDNWRRDNVNIFIEMVHDSIKATKKHVKFGVSPFGIWKSGTPAGITGLSSYYDIYCDPINWLSNHKIDYILPQLYWAIGGSQDFNALANWWGTQAMLYNRHCYAGIATSRLPSTSSNWPISEIKNQINTVRSFNSKVQGMCFWSGTQLLNNTKGIRDTLNTNQNKYLCLIPTMPWLDSIKPNPPVNVTTSVVSNTVNFHWQLPAVASDGDSAHYFVIYRFPNVASVNLTNAKAIIGITSTDTIGFIDPTPLATGSVAVYVVTACDRLHNESNPVQMSVCNGCDNTNPTTQITTPNGWQTQNFTANYIDADNVGGSGIEQGFYQPSYFNGTEWRANGNKGFFNDDFNTATIHPDWTNATGIWSIASGALTQTDQTNTNTNIYTSLVQNLSDSYLYHFKGTISGTGTSRRAGIHIFCDNVTQTNRGNNYLIWMRSDQGTIELYRNTSNTLSVVKTVTFSISPNTAYDYKILYNRLNGELSLWINNAFVTSWIDPNPLTTGNAVSFRSGNCAFTVDDFKVFRSRTNSSTILVGSNNTNDLRNENPSPTTAAGKISSITKDNADNISAITSQTLHVDWTKPFVSAFIKDGTSADIDTTGVGTQLSLNYAAAKDTNSGIVTYYYAIGTSAGAKNITSWTANGTNTLATQTGLNLISNQKYFTMVKAMNGAGLMSDSIVSDGVLYLSSLIGIKENNWLNSLSVYPNPTTNRATISLISTTNEKVYYTLLDIQGKLVEEKELSVVSGVNTLDINVEQLKLSKGTYYIRLMVNHQAITKKLIVE